MNQEWNVDNEEDSNSLSQMILKPFQMTEQMWIELHSCFLFIEDSLNLTYMRIAVRRQFQWLLRVVSKYRAWLPDIVLVAVDKIPSELFVYTDAYVNKTVRDNMKDFIDQFRLFLKDEFGASFSDVKVMSPIRRQATLQLVKENIQKIQGKVNFSVLDSPELTTVHVDSEAWSQLSEDIKNDMKKYGVKGEVKVCFSEDGEALTDVRIDCQVAATGLCIAAN